MSIAGGIVTYIIIWWLVLFMVLPWGITSQRDAGDITPGTADGAPVKPQLVKKILITTGVATVGWAIFVTLMVNDIIHLGDIPKP
ncbi:MAG: DUF1467 family protein [Alphaproteobacteria bacterium]